jgi:predicted esterase
MPMNVWFNRTSRFIELGVDDTEDNIGIERSIDMIMNEITKSGSTYNNVYLGGFSMGGGLVLHFLRKNLPQNVKGIFTMGSFLVNRSAVFNENNNLNKLPVFMMHGKNDSLIPIDWGRKTASNLILRNVDVQFQEYEGLDHELGTEELVALLHWIEDINKNPEKDQKNSIISKDNVENIDTCPHSIARRMDENRNIVDEDGNYNTQNDDNSQPNNQSPLDYTLQFSSSSSSSVRIIYHVPEDTYELLVFGGWDINPPKQKIKFVLWVVHL